MPEGIESVNAAPSLRTVTAAHGESTGNLHIARPVPVTPFPCQEWTRNRYARVTFSGPYLGAEGDFKHCV